MTATFDIQLAAAVVVAEAGGESDPRAIPAVCEVIRNRVASGRWGDLRHTLLKRGQFSCLNHVSRNQRHLAMWVESIKAHPAFFRALDAFTRTASYYTYAFTRTASYYTYGSLYYHEQSKSPKWARGHKPVVVIGKHKFFNDILINF
jgi:spore germination cell wall hydrolase CwlJ-like protein